MASANISMRKKKSPKAPKMTASKSTWDRYEMKKKEVDAHNKKVESEKARRQRIRQK